MPACARSMTTARWTLRSSRATMPSISTRRRTRAPALSIFGGKITTARRLAEHALDELAPFVPREGRGLDGKMRRYPAAICRASRDFSLQLKRDKPFLSRRARIALGARLWDARLCHSGRCAVDGGSRPRFRLRIDRSGAALSRDEEWARTAEDVLWRRSKLGLHMSEDQQRAVRNSWAENSWRKSDREPPARQTADKVGDALVLRDDCLQAPQDGGLLIGARIRARTIGLILGASFSSRLEGRGRSGSLSALPS